MRALLTVLLLLLVPAAQAQEPLALRLTLVHFKGGAWQEGEIEAAAAQASSILGQCGIVPGTAQVLRADVDGRFRIYRTPAARELAHVLMDSGEHSGAPGNLMRDETASENTWLSEAQCVRLRVTGSANGLLGPVK